MILSLSQEEIEQIIEEYVLVHYDGMERAECHIQADLNGSAIAVVQVPLSGVIIT